MHVRPLALAALILLFSAPAAAHAVETAPPPAPVLVSPADPAHAGPPDGDEPAGGADPLPGAGPADLPAPAPGPGSGASPVPDDAGLPRPDELPLPVPGGHTAPDTEDPGSAAAPGTAPDGSADTDTAESTGVVPTSPAGPAVPAGHQSGSGALLRPDAEIRAQVLPGRHQVAPGTLTRISPGTVTRVPAQEQAAGSATTVWALGLSVLVAAAVLGGVVHRSRVRRARP